MNFIKISLSLICFFMISCSGNYKMVQYERDENFFDVFVNNSSSIGEAAAKIESIKLLQTGDQFPIRIALYNNGKFYYQVDELGTGVGDWKFEDGGLKLTTHRKVFDMNFYLTAAKDDGQDVVVKFFDRHGFNQHKMEFRNPEANQNLEKLREYKSSIKDI